MSRVCIAQIGAAQARPGEVGAEDLAGTDKGVKVTFTIVAVDSSLVAPGTFSITLSDGYSNSGPLLTGSITVY